MAVNSIGTLSTNLSSFYQSISGGTQPSTLTATWSPTPPSAVADTPTEDQDTQSLSRTSDKSFNQIEAAVSTALNAAQSNATADPSAIIQQAIGQTFGAAAALAGTSALPGNNSGANVSADSASAGGQGNPNSSAATQAYLDALRSLAVDPQQFHDDLVSAVKDAQEGRVDPSTVFRNFPVGSSLDAVA